MLGFGIELKKNYLKIGTGYDCAGQSNVELCFSLMRTVRDSSPDVNFGETLPTGSKEII